ncbi:hypothetical protein EMIT0111MI5_290003 [Burkholderia sp. IT-111MI5]
MKHDDPPVDDRSAKHTCDTFQALQPHFVQPVAHRPGVRFARIRAVLLHAVSECEESGGQRFRQRKYASLDLLAEEMDFVRDGSHSNKFVISLQEGAPSCLS